MNIYNTLRKNSTYPFYLPFLRFCFIFSFPCIFELFLLWKSDIFVNQAFSFFACFSDKNLYICVWTQLKIQTYAPLLR